MTPEQRAAFLALMSAEAARNAELEKNLLAEMDKLVAAMGAAWFYARATEWFKRAAYDLVRTAQELQALNTLAYLSEIYELFGIRVPRTRRDTWRLPDNLRRGVEDIDTWDRPARDARARVILDGLDDFEAEERARNRAREQAVIDMLNARREAERHQWGLSEDVIGYRRVLHPEMSRTGPCGLCIVAATRIYKKKDLRPMHGGCWCTVAPVTKSLDPGNSINEDELGDFYERGRNRDDLRRIRVRVLDHGELGPILVDGDGKVLDEVGVKRRDKGFDPARVVKAQRKAIDRLESERESGRQIDERRLEQHREWLEKWLAELPADHPLRAA